MAIEAFPPTVRPTFSPISFLRRITDNFLLQRILKSLLTVWVVTTLSFLLFRAMPGNAIEVAIQERVINQGMAYDLAKAEVESLFNIDLDRPMILQYFDFWTQLFQGDLGNSFTRRGTTVLAIITGFMPWTLFSVGLGLLISFVLGIGLGILTAYRREGFIDHILSFLGSILVGMPVGVLVIIMIVALAPITGVGWVDWSKMRGAYSPNITPGFTLEFAWDVLWHASIPVLTYALLNVSGWMLRMKSNTVSALEEDYVAVARAKGLSDPRIATAYVGRNAILPLVTQLTLAFAFSIGGSALIERYFVYRGIGGELGAAVGNRDYPVMQGIFLMITIVVVFGNLITDLLYGVIDPRIRLGGEKK